MTNQPLVTVLLNCYNEEKNIKKCVSSILKQTYKNWELIVLDDASLDNTVKIIKKIKDKRIRLYQNLKNLGLGKSRIKAQRYIKGKYVTIIDGDDFFEKKKIKEQVEILNRNSNIGLVSTWTKILNSKDKKVIREFKSYKNNNHIKKNLFYLNSIPHSSIMYRKNLAQKVGWYSKKLDYAQDYDLTLKILGISDFYLIRKFLTNITTGEKNMSSINKYLLISIQETISILEKNKNNKILNKQDKLLLSKIIKINYLKLYLNMSKKQPFKNFLRIINIIIRDPLIVLKINLLSNINEQKKSN